MIRRTAAGVSNLRVCIETSLQHECQMNAKMKAVFSDGGFPTLVLCEIAPRMARQTPPKSLSEPPGGLSETRLGRPKQCSKRARQRHPPGDELEVKWLRECWPQSFDELECSDMDGTTDQTRWRRLDFSLSKAHKE